MTEMSQGEQNQRDTEKRHGESKRQSEPRKAEKEEGRQCPLQIFVHWKQISLPDHSGAQNRWRGEKERSVLSLFDTSRLGEGGQGQSGNYPPLGLDWSVTTQDPSSTPTGLTQNLGHPPRMAVSPPTAWLQSDYSRSAKRLQTPMSRLPNPPSSFAFFLSSLFSFLPGSLGSSLPLFGHWLGGRGSLLYQAPFPGLGLDAPSLQGPLGLVSLRHVPCLAWELINTKKKPVRLCTKHGSPPQPP